MLVGTNRKPLMQSVYLTNELTPLKNSLNALIKANPSLDASIFVWDSSNGNYVDINGETPYPAASIIKIPVLISMFKAIEKRVKFLEYNRVVEMYEGLKIVSQSTW